MFIVLLSYRWAKLFRGVVAIVVAPMKFRMIFCAWVKEFLRVKSTYFRWVLGWPYHVVRLFSIFGLHGGEHSCGHSSYIPLLVVSLMDINYCWKMLEASEVELRATPIPNDQLVLITYKPPVINMASRELPIWMGPFTIGKMSNYINYILITLFEVAAI